MSDIYKWPIYQKSVQDQLVEFCTGNRFDHWNLGNLYDEVPCQFAQKLGARYGLFCSTGTAGLHSSLIALGLLPGDEVIVPSMTFIRAVTPLVHLNLQPVVADVCEDTGNMVPFRFQTSQKSTGAKRPSICGSKI